MSNPLDQSVALTGHCLCGGVRYEILQRPRAMYHCHCSTCRRASGASFATNVIVASGALRISSGGELLKSFESSPGKKRHFCARCGSPIFSQARDQAQWTSVRSGTLDVDPGVRPSFNAYVESKAPWTDLPAGIDCFPGAKLIQEGRQGTRRA